MVFSCHKNIFHSLPPCQNLYTGRKYHYNAIAYCGESKNRLKFLCLPEFRYRNTLRLLLLRVNYIQLQIKSCNFHGLIIKTKRILRLKLGQIHVNMTCIAERYYEFTRYYLYVIFWGLWHSIPTYAIPWPHQSITLHWQK